MIEIALSPSAKILLRAISKLSFILVYLILMTYPSMASAVDPSAHKSFSQSDRSFLFQLDNWGLTPNQYRVYLHLALIASSNKATISIDSIHKICKLSRTTILRVINQLCQLKLIERQTLVGKESTFYLLPYEQWKQPTRTKNERVGSKVLEMKPFEPTHTKNEQVSQTDGLEERYIPPLRGYISPPTEPVSETDQVASGTGIAEEQVEPTDLSKSAPVNQDLNNTPEPVFADEYAKREALCKLGIQAGIVWIERNTSIAVVNCVRMSVEEFMKRSWSSLTQSRRIYAPTL